MPTTDREAPDVSIVVPVHNNGPTIGIVVRAILPQLGDAGQAELIIVDDGSCDGPLEAIGDASRDVRLRYLRNDRSRGAAAARNRGIRLARGRLLILSDGDCVPCDGFVEAHLALHHRHPAEHLVVLGNLRYPPGVRVTPLMRLGNVVEFWGGPGSFEAGTPERVPTGVSTDFTLFRTTNVSLKRSFIGDGFREVLGPGSGWEDNDLGLQLAARGMQVIGAPEAVSWHHHFLDPVTYLEKTYRYGVLFREWIRHLDPEIRQMVRAKLGYELDLRHPLSWDNLRKIRKRVLVNRVTFPAIRLLAQALEKRSESLSAKLYWKLHPHLFMSGFRGRVPRILGRSASQSTSGLHPTGAAPSRKAPPP